MAMVNYLNKFKCSDEMTLWQLIFIINLIMQLIVISHIKQQEMAAWYRVAPACSMTCIADIAACIAELCILVELATVISQWLYNNTGQNSPDLQTQSYTLYLLSL